MLTESFFYADTKLLWFDYTLNHVLKCTQDETSFININIYTCLNQACVNLQTDNCADPVLEYWPYWNHNANDTTFFSQDDLNCKDQNTCKTNLCI